MKAHTTIFADPTETICFAVKYFLCHLEASVEYVRYVSLSKKDILSEEARRGFAHVIASSLRGGSKFWSLSSAERFGHHCIRVYKTKPSPSETIV